MTEEQKRKTVIRPNDSLNVSMMMLDAGQRAVADRLAPANHRPGFAVLSDADRTKRAALVADSNRALSDRWKNPVDLMPKAPLVIQPAATKDAAYASYDERLAMRWRAA